MILIRRNRSGVLSDTNYKRLSELVGTYLLAKGQGRIREEYVEQIEALFQRLGDMSGFSRWESLAPVATPKPEPTPVAPIVESQPEPTPAAPQPESTPVAPVSPVAEGDNLSLRNFPPIKMAKGERLDANRKAIQLLAEKKKFTYEEKANVLRLYTGNGGLQVDNQGVLNQHYTSYFVTKFIWDKIESLGIKGGWFLEPGCGNGNFIGMKPNSQFHVLGVDYDPNAIAVATVLYPEDELRLQDLRYFEWESHTPYLTGVIGNIPFGNYSRFQRSDPFADLKPLIHDWLILRSIHTVNPGGIVALITSSGTMDKVETKYRAKMIEMAHLLGAYRLPNSAFKENASTEVTTDILFFQKRESPITIPTDTNEIAFIQGSNANEAGKAQDIIRPSSYYYTLNPANVFGTLAIEKRQFGPQMEVHGSLTPEFLDLVVKRNDMSLPLAIIPPKENTNKKRVESIDAEIASAELILACVKKTINLQLEKADAPDVQTSRHELKSAIDTHVKKFGTPGDSNKIREHYLANSDWYTLKNIVTKGGKYSTIVTENTTFTAVFEPKPASEKLTDVILFFRQTGKVSSIENLVEYYKGKKSKAQLIAEIESGNDVFIVQEGTEETCQLRVEYLSGFLTPKIKHAEATGQTRNLTALKAALPVPKTVDEISADILDINTYLPVEIGKSFVKYVLDGTLSGIKGNWEISGSNYSLSTDMGWGWSKDYEKILRRYLNDEKYPKEPSSKYDTPKELMQKEFDRIDNNNRMRTEIPRQFMEWVKVGASKEHRDLVVKHWNENFNATVEPNFDGDTFSLSEIAGIWTNGKPFVPRYHQKRFVEKALFAGSYLNAHGVGAGKTLTAILLSGALRQRGLARKPIFAVPSKVIEKWIAEYLACFPNARILNLKTDKARKEDYLSLAQMNEYDAVFVTHEGFTSIPVSAELRERYTEVRKNALKEQISQLSEQMDEKEIAAAETMAQYEGDENKGGGRPKVKLTQKGKLLKDLQLALIRYDQKVKLALEGEKLSSVSWDEIGFDALFVDEAHNFKNLFLSAKAAELGIGVPASSNRAEELSLKIWHLNEMTKNRNIFMLTATPTNNTPLEAYIFLSMVAPSYLKELSLDNVDDFINQFAQTEIIDTVDVVGNPVERNVVVGYKNLNALRKIFNQYVEFLDVSELSKLVEEDAKRKGITATNSQINRPDLEALEVLIPQTSDDEAIAEDLQDRAKKVRSKDPKLFKRDDGKSVLDSFLMITTTGSRAAVDPAFYAAKYDYNEISPGSKADTMCHRVLEAHWKQPKDVTNKAGEVSKGVKNGQLIFCDPLTTTKGRNFHASIRDRLVELGIPKSEIEIINGTVNNKPEQKKAVQDRFNLGTTRIVIGNTAGMGEGMDLNRFCTDIHHLDVPWKPSELTQRNGRGHRQGNANSVVRVHYYFKKRSMDIYRMALLNKKQRWINELWNGTDDTSSGEADTGLDYETVMMALQDDPVRIGALELSRDAKRIAKRVNGHMGTYKQLQYMQQNAERELENLEGDRGINARVIAALVDNPKPPYNVDEDALKGVKTLEGLVSYFSMDRKYGYHRSEMADGTGIVWQEHYTMLIGQSGIALLSIATPFKTEYDPGASKMVNRHYGIINSPILRGNGDYIVRSDESVEELFPKLKAALLRTLNDYAYKRSNVLTQYDHATTAVKIYSNKVMEEKRLFYGYLNAYLSKVAEIKQRIADNPGTALFIDDDDIIDTLNNAMGQRIESFDQVDEKIRDKLKRAVISDNLLDENGELPMATIRKNPSAWNGISELVYLGRVRALGTSQGVVSAVIDNDTYEAASSKPVDNKTIAQMSYLFTNPEMNILLITPKHRVGPTHLDASGDAAEAFEVFHSYLPDNNDFAVELPEPHRKRRVGVAKWIGYTSDKVIEYTDRKGKPNQYIHDFENNQRVYQYDDTFLIRGIEIDRRGILN